MVKSLILSFLLFLTGCNGFSPTLPSKIDKLFIPYVEQYKKDKYNYTGINYIRNIDIVFFTLNKQFDGMCRIYSDGYRLIEIDPTYWFQKTEDEKIILIYHELGHCDLNLQHSNTTSIMNPISSIISNDFSINRNYYLTLLFKKGI